MEICREAMINTVTQMVAVTEVDVYIAANAITRAGQIDQACDLKVACGQSPTRSYFAGGAQTQ